MKLQKLVKQVTAIQTMLQQQQGGQQQQNGLRSSDADGEKDIREPQDDDDDGDDETEAERNIRFGSN